METKIIIGATYLHYKGTEYIPSKIVKYEATGEDWVVYGDKDGNEYVTPAKRWFNVVWVDLEGGRKYRFTLVANKPVIEYVTMIKEEFEAIKKEIYEDAYVDGHSKFNHKYSL